MAFLGHVKLTILMLAIGYIERNVAFRKPSVEITAGKS